MRKYRTIRNRVTSMIRQDTIRSKDKRMEEAGSENEVWKIVKDITAP